MTRNVVLLSIVASCAVGMSAGHAGEVAALTTFTAGTPAKAGEVNGNFTAVKTAVDDSHAQIVALQQTVASLQDALADLQATVEAQAGELTAQATEIGAQAGVIAELQNSQVMALEPYLTVDSDALRVQISGINLQIVNGRGATASSNGRGNLIIGYDEPRDEGASSCSIGVTAAGVLIADEASCEAEGGVWALSHKSGSHYLVIGSKNNYSSFGGMVLGSRNISNNQFASAIGGSDNQASGRLSVVSGGYRNTASGVGASVSGGTSNQATGSGASVSGGFTNTASGGQAAVSGGIGNHASGSKSSVSGGWSNTASGDSASVSGGIQNTASGDRSSVSGGGATSAAADNSWAAGNLTDP